MERDAIIAHGGSGILKARLFEQSDYYTCWVCPECGLYAQRFRKGVYECIGCKVSTAKEVAIPYAAKLLTQELISLCIRPKLEIK